MWICGLCPCSGVQPLKACMERAIACIESYFFSFRLCLCTQRFGWIKAINFLAISKPLHFHAFYQHFLNGGRTSFCSHININQGVIPLTSDLI